MSSMPLFHKFSKGGKKEHRKAEAEAARPARHQTASHGKKKKLPGLFNMVPKRLLDESATELVDFAKMFSFLMPRLKTDLIQAQMDEKPERYISMCLISSIFFFAVLNTTFLVTMALSGKIGLVLPFTGVSGVVSFFMFFSLFFYPHNVALARMKDLEKNLLTALRHVIIKVRSGVPLYHAMASLSEGYGELSKEMSTMVEKVNAGVPFEQALDDAAAMNPSAFFRRTLIQISVAIKSGADINRTFDSIISQLSELTIISARRYGRELNFWSVFYLIISIIFPAMGISFFVMLSSFMGFVLDFYTFSFVLLGIIGLQAMFIMLINGRKPSLVVY
jgi:pilus assembly protein TadC